MRGTIDVIDPDDPTAALHDVDPPGTDWVASGIDLDGAHDGRFVPETPPDAVRGAALWQAFARREPAEAAPALELRRLSPSDVYARLGSLEAPVPAAVRALGSRDRWDVIAHLWYAATTPGALATGARLYRRDCTGCHGSSGRGDGPGAEAIAQATGHHGGGRAPKRPVDFTRLAGQAGASDLLYYGKLVRGGMGTSMPYWGTMYREDELWAVVAYLRSFAFRFPMPDMDLAQPPSRGQPR
jgi:mono/diheme cytochrome c family protein